MMFRLFQIPFFITTLMLGVVSCAGRGQYPGSPVNDTVEDSISVEYAQGFTIKKQGDITVVTVLNPWQGAQNVAYRYVLCPKGKTIPREFSDYPVIYTPVERVVCLATTHIAMLSALGKTASVKALSGTAYVSDTTIRHAVAKGEVVDIGYDQGLNYERIISLKPDVIFAYGVGEEVVGRLARLTDLGMKVVLNAEYLERTALGKAEWIKFMAEFYDCGKLAEEGFNTVENEYDALCRLVKGTKHNPTILCGLPWQGTWYIPGGETSIAGMIADAGGDYLWKSNTSHESFPVNIEAIISKAGGADLWINTGAARTLKEIQSVDERLKYVTPYRTGMVYNNYARVSPGGGNDFFESGVVNPHIILKDMIRIFHPDLLPDHELYYYMKLE